ncbi:hypothetical protein [Roseibium alexandrii]|nr:hypothetical protein [Roseibium alexandrii]
MHKYSLCMSIAFSLVNQQPTSDTSLSHQWLQVVFMSSTNCKYAKSNLGSRLVLIELIHKLFSGWYGHPRKRAVLSDLPAALKRDIGLEDIRPSPGSLEEGWRSEFDRLQRR